MKKTIAILIVLAIAVTTIFSNVLSVAAASLGDVSGDGKISSTDVSLVERYVVGSGNLTSDQIKVADINSDGKINSTDAAMITRYVLGMSTMPPSATVATTVPPTTVAPTTTKPAQFHVFLLLGQSNMAGYPKALDSDKVQDKRIEVLDYYNNTWRVATPPLHESYQGAIGPGDWFAKTIVNYVPAGDTIGLVPCAISGEKIETFMKSGGTKYSWILDRAKKAQQRGGIIDGILFHQGESNNGDSSWPGKVNTLITDLRTDLGIGNVPFLAGELLYSGGCAGHNTQVNKLPSTVKNAYVISASGLVQDSTDTQWKLHFSHDSQVEFGKRYAAKMIEVLGWKKQQ